MDSGPKGDALIEMKILVTIQEEGYAPYTMSINNEGFDKDYPYATHLHRPGSAGLGADFESTATAGEWVGQWVKEYMEKTEEEDKLKK